MTKTDVLFLSENERLEKDIRKTLYEARVRLGTTKAVAQALGWSLASVREWIRQPVSPDLPGTEISSFTFDDLRDKTKPQLRQQIRIASIRAIEHIGSNDVIAVCLDTDESSVRRARARATKVG